MFWDSVVLMTLVDVFLVSVAAYAGAGFLRALKNSRDIAKAGPLAVMLGLALVAAFYLVDLAAMHLLPLHVPMPEAMAFMQRLHLDYSWPVTVVAIGAIALGSAATNREMVTASRLLLESREHLKQSEERFRHFAQAASDWLWETDDQHRFVTFYAKDDDPKRDRVLNAPALGSTRIERRLPEDTDDEKWRKHQDDLDARRPFKDLEFPNRDIDGSVRHIRASGQPIFADDGTFVGYRGISSDVTEQKLKEQLRLALINEKEREIQARHSAERERDEALARLSEAVESISEGFSVWDADNRMLMCNSKHMELFSELSDILEPGLRFESFLRAAVERGVYKLGDHTLDSFVQANLEEHRNPSGAYERKMGSGRWLRISKQRTQSGGIVGTWTDITEGKMAEEKIRELALKDSLTDLANRTQFQQRLGKAIKIARKYDKKVALFFLDLDHFKKVNDEFGHPYGDNLLQQVAQRFNRVTRDIDTVARLGGDEFAIIMTNAENDETASAFAQRLLDTTFRPFTVDGRDLTIGASIGISIYPDDDTDPTELMRKADLALYQAKSRGRGVVQIYDHEMHSATKRAQTLEADLRVALANDQLVLHYQPQLDIGSETVLAAEALVRWQHPERGLLAPWEFIPVAESSGLIVELGNWAIAEACAQVQRWQVGDLPPLRVAVNISPRQFKSSDLVAVVEKALHSTGLEPHRLELEITESMVMHDIDHAMTRLAEIRGLGVEIAIDDFGTGYSSLARLKRFPVQRLKIDRSFVSMLSADSPEAAIVESVIRLGHGLGVKVVAEGIETEQELSVLRDLGCDEAQGYYFCRPADANKIHDWLVANHRSKTKELAEAPV